MTTNFEIFDSSEHAKTIDADGARAQIGEEKYPWRSLSVGKSFFINAKTNTVKLQTMQSAASRWSKKLNKNFRVVKHDTGIEVARLPDIVGNETVTEVLPAETVTEQPKKIINFFEEKKET